MLRRVADAVKAVRATGKARFTGFLNEREIQLATAELNRLHWEGRRFWGGYEGAERMMLCVFEDYESCSAFPIECMGVDVPEGESLTHRDYLGAILGKGIERTCVGDILVHSAGAKVFLQARMFAHVEQELDSVGRLPASTKKADEAQTAAEPRMDGEAKTVSIPSARLDAVLAAMLHLSRTDATALVQKGLVQVNHLLVGSLHYQVCEGDVFSVRGHGKYRVNSIGGKSRKNRTFMQYYQY